jgi:glutamyl-tRNA reductase
LGETAIQGQVKDAYEKARSGLTLSPELHRLFQWTLKTGKRVRTETSLSRGAMSYGKAVIEILKQDLVNLREARILIIGVNNLNYSLIRYLTENGSQTVFIANRTYYKALSLARKFSATAVRFNRLREQLRKTDLLISATSAPHVIVKKDDLNPDQPLLIFDLAVPRDIDPAIGNNPNIRLFNIEDVERRITFNRENRLQEIAKAEKIIEEEIGYFYA